MVRVLSETKLAARYTSLGAAMAIVLDNVTARATTVPADVPQNVYREARGFFTQTMEGVRSMETGCAVGATAVQHWWLAVQAVRQTFSPALTTYEEANAALRRFNNVLHRLEQPRTPTDEERVVFQQLADFFTWIAKEGGAEHYREYMDRSCGHLADTL